jgi:hypothetical protein
MRVQVTCSWTWRGQETLRQQTRSGDLQVTQVGRHTVRQQPVQGSHWQQRSHTMWLWQRPGTQYCS